MYTYMYLHIRVYELAFVYVYVYVCECMVCRLIKFELYNTKIGSGRVFR